MPTTQINGTAKAVVTRNAKSLNSGHRPAPAGSVGFAVVVPAVTEGNCKRFYADEDVRFTVMTIEGSGAGCLTPFVTPARVVLRGWKPTLLPKQNSLRLTLNGLMESTGKKVDDKPTLAIAKAMHKAVLRDFVFRLDERSPIPYLGFGLGVPEWQIIDHILLDDFQGERAVILPCGLVPFTQSLVKDAPIHYASGDFSFHCPRCSNEVRDVRHTIKPADVLLSGVKERRTSKLFCEEFERDAAGGLLLQASETMRYDGVVTPQAIDLRGMTAPQIHTHGQWHQFTPGTAEAFRVFLPARAVITLPVGEVFVDGDVVVTGLLEPTHGGQRLTYPGGLPGLEVLQRAWASFKLVRGDGSILAPAGLFPEFPAYGSVGAPTINPVFLFWELGTLAIACARRIQVDFNHPETGEIMPCTAVIYPCGQRDNLHFELGELTLDARPRGFQVTKPHTAQRRPNFKCDHRLLSHLEVLEHCNALPESARRQAGSVRRQLDAVGYLPAVVKAASVVTQRLQAMLPVAVAVN